VDSTLCLVSDFAAASSGVPLALMDGDDQITARRTVAASARLAISYLALS
jgi:ornithine cyclodeaminase/alanine dehydrogenase-like protein (mu-crystallin family)